MDPDFRGGDRNFQRYWSLGTDRIAPNRLSRQTAVRSHGYQSEPASLALETAESLATGKISTVRAAHRSQLSRVSYCRWRSNSQERADLLLADVVIEKQIVKVQPVAAGTERNTADDADLVSPPLAVRSFMKHALCIRQSEPPES